MLTTGAMQVLTALRANGRLDYERYKKLCSDLAQFLDGVEIDLALATLLSYVLVIVCEKIRR